MSVLLPEPSGQAELAWALTTICNADRIKRYERFRDYYNGKHDLQFATVKFNQAFGLLFKAFGYNRCRAVVRAHTDRLYVESFDAGENTKVVDRAEELWGINRMDKVQLEIHRDALTTGAGYLWVWTDPSGDKPVVMWPQSPVNMAVRYAEHDPTLLEVAGKVWRNRYGYTRATIYMRDRLERWISLKATEKDSTVPKVDDMQPYNDDGLGSVITNPYDRVPIFPFFNHPVLGDTLGCSELNDVMPLQNAINKTLTDELVTEEFMAYPQRVISGIDPESNPYGDQSQEERANQQKFAQFSAGQLRILTLSDPASKVQEFSAARLDQYTNMADFWDKAISRVSTVPVHWLTLSSDFPSGRALRTAEAPFVAKLQGQQETFSDPWEDSQRFAQEVAGPGEVKGRFGVKWRSAAPMAQEDEMDLVLQMIATGIPLEIALADIGWSASKIEEVVDARDKAVKEQMRMAAQGFAPEENAPNGDLNTAQRVNKTTQARKGNMRVVA
jgi:hypothetical protein